MFKKTSYLGFFFFFVSVRVNDRFFVSLTLLQYLCIYCFQLKEVKATLSLLTYYNPPPKKNVYKRLQQCEYDLLSEEYVSIEVT